jgi:hypothetical protein
MRAEFARDAYQEKLEEMGESGKTYRGYDEKVLREVSKALGHNRISIVVYHYLR